MILGTHWRHKDIVGKTPQTTTIRAWSETLDSAEKPPLHCCCVLRHFDTRASRPPNVWAVSQPILAGLAL